MKTLEDMKVSLERIEQGQNVLCERLDTLTKAIQEHDQWAKDYNVTVEARNKRVSEQMTQWKAEQEKAVTGLCNLFESYLRDLHALAKPSKRRGK